MSDRFHLSVSRRRFLATSAMAAAAAAVPLVDAEAEDDVRVTRLPVSVPDLPAGLDGATIAHVTDLHFYRAEPHPAALRALSILERERPDLLVLTGDQWDHPDGMEGYRSWLRARPAALPAVAVLGNHEYSTGTGDRADTVRSAERLHEQGDAELLVNAITGVSIGGHRLSVVGLDDLRHGHPTAEHLDSALDSAQHQLWLFHEPAQVLRLAWPPSAAPFLMLAGHTHGGQIRFPLLPALTPRGSGPYVAGRYATPRGPLYVSRGVGASGPRIRYRCPAEVALFRLGIS
jgi:predicted MPP superfamily phosphohydrolase